MEEVALSALPRETESDSDSSDSALSKSEDELSERNQCPDPGRGGRFERLSTPILFHDHWEDPHKCPVKTCEYHMEGFAQAFQLNRHILTHYKGTLVCGFCPDPGTKRGKTFNRADAFKHHLTSVHGVEQTPPNMRRRSPANAKLISATNKPAGNNPGDTMGRCATCGGTFTNAQSFYEHLDDCVMITVMQDKPTPIVEPGIMPPGLQPQHARNNVIESQQVKNQILSLLRQKQHQNPPQGWQATVGVAMRAMNVFLL